MNIIDYQQYDVTTPTYAEMISYLVFNGWEHVSGSFLYKKSIDGIDHAINANPDIAGWNHLAELIIMQLSALDGVYPSQIYSRIVGHTIPGSMADLMEFRFVCIHGLRALAAVFPDKLVSESISRFIEDIE